MRFIEKKSLRKKINIDITIGVCVGILGNAIYIYASQNINSLIVIALVGVVLLILIYKKEDEMSDHIQTEIYSNRKIEKSDIFHIKDGFVEKIKINWKTKDIRFIEDKVIQIFQEDMAILRITFSDTLITFDYYSESSEAKYLLEKFIEVLKEYKPKDAQPFNGDSFKTLDQIKVIPGPVIYRGD